MSDLPSIQQHALEVDIWGATLPVADFFKESQFVGTLLGTCEMSPVIGDNINLVKSAFKKGS